MAFYYFDASALVKYYILEPGSTWVRELINATDVQGKRSAHTIFMADLSAAEVAAAFAVLHRTGRILRPVCDGAFDQFMDSVPLLRIPQSTYPPPMIARTLIISLSWGQ